MLIPILIELGSDHEAYGVTIPDLPGCFSAGETLEQAIENSRIAIGFHLEEVYAQDGKFPNLKGLQHWTSQPEFQSYVCVLIEIDATEHMGRKEKINVTLPSGLIRKIDNKVANSDLYKSRSNFLAVAAYNELEASSKK